MNRNEREMLESLEADNERKQVALEYGMELYERAVAQRDDLKQRVQVLTAQLNATRAALSRHIENYGEVLLAEGDQGLPITVSPQGDQLRFSLYTPADEEVDPDQLDVDPEEEYRAEVSE